MENDEANILKSLMKEKDSIEAEIKELTDVLDSVNFILSNLLQSTYAYASRIRIQHFLVLSPAHRLQATFLS